MASRRRERFVAALPHIRIVGLSTHDDEIIERSMREAGAEAYFTKNEGADRLLDYLLSVRDTGKRSGEKLIQAVDRYTHWTPRVLITGISGRPYPPESGGSLVRHVLSANKRGGSLAFIVGNGVCPNLTA